ncbi:DUF2946 family protein [Roseobacter sp. HKCCA0434]|uniref:DUF2946 family protein n=1 Tax=Roseobacter sp. HKCCA0434 TaxID=3079297 RepID=UPI002905F06E|nr:hypothetical protein [Roseobacter sp. HKCCA0434]
MNPRTLIAMLALLLTVFTTTVSAFGLQDRADQDAVVAELAALGLTHDDICGGDDTALAHCPLCQMLAEPVVAAPGDAVRAAVYAVSVTPDAAFILSALDARMRPPGRAPPLV